MKGDPSIYEAVRPAPGATALRLTPGLLSIMAALILGPWLLAWGVVKTSIKPAANGQPAASLPSSTGRSEPFAARSGAWGVLECTRIAIEPPTEYFYVDLSVRTPPTWFFKNHTVEQVRAILAGAQLNAGQAATLSNAAIWEQRPGGVLLRPDRETVLSLSRESRRAIYDVLGRFLENAPQTQSISFDSTSLTAQFSGSGLKPETIARVEALLYPRHKRWLFSDLDTLLYTIPDHDERMRLTKGINRRHTMLIRVTVNEQSDIKALAKYWGYDGRAKDLEPLLESLSRIPGGGSVDIAHLLPPFARQRIYTYPFPGREPIVSQRDCHWTSFNFFNDKVDDKFVEAGSVRHAIETQYEQISGTPHLGDILVLMKPSGELIHSAVFITDEILFTKNGSNPTQPWIFMTFPELMSFYTAFTPVNEGVHMACYRRKNT